jgi:hypothetical protein
MSTIKSTDYILVQRGTTLYKAPADMSTIKDTDLLLINRGGVDYKCTYADWKKSQPHASVIGGLVLADNAPGAPAFTSQKFTSTLTMTDDGQPSSTKGIRAFVQGKLSVPRVSAPITKVTPSPDPPLYTGLTSAQELQIVLKKSRNHDGGWTNECCGVKINGAWITAAMLRRATITTDGDRTASHLYDRDIHTSMSSSLGSSGHGYREAEIQITLYNLPAVIQTIEVYIPARDDAASYIGVVSGPSGATNPPQTNLLGRTGWVPLSPMNPATLELESDVNLSHFKQGMDITESGNGNDGVGGVSTIDYTIPGIKFFGDASKWNVGSRVASPPEIQDHALKYLVLDSNLNVTDLSGAEQTFTPVTGNGPYIITFPATLPSGQAPDAELPAGITITTEVKATNSAGATTRTSNSILPTR